MTTTLRKIKIIINQHYLKARKKQARIFKEMWEAIYKELTGEPIKQKTPEKSNEINTSNTNTNDSENLSEIIKKSIKEEIENNKPVSQSGEVFCKHCGQNVYPEEYNHHDKVCLMCERKWLEEKEE